MMPHLKTLQKVTINAKFKSCKSCRFLPNWLTVDQITFNPSKSKKDWFVLENTSRLAVIFDRKSHKEGVSLAKIAKMKQLECFSISWNWYEGDFELFTSLLKVIQSQVSFPNHHKGKSSLINQNSPKLFVYYISECFFQRV